MISTVPTSQNNTARIQKRDEKLTRVAWWEIASTHWALSQSRSLSNEGLAATVVFARNCQQQKKTIGHRKRYHTEQYWIVPKSNCLKLCIKTDSHQYQLTSRTVQITKATTHKNPYKKVLICKEMLKTESEKTKYSEEGANIPMFHYYLINSVRLN